MATFKLSMIPRFFYSISKSIAGGCEIVPARVYEERMAICHSCEHRDGTQCGICGCILKAKCKLSTSVCALEDTGLEPLWGEYTECRQNAHQV